MQRYGCKNWQNVANENKNNICSFATVGLLKKKPGESFNIPPEKPNICEVQKIAFTFTFT